ncbi:MAG: MerR family transcriptional regulator [Longicatena sp.]
MKIKEVESSIGLSAHNIRFYEEMGLIKIERDPENKYREFTNENIKRLKEIKLFRSLGITMEEIRRYYEHEITLEELMEHQAKELQSLHHEMQMKEKLCEDIQKSKIPLTSYTMDHYEDIIVHKREHIPLDKAGDLISSWNKTQYSKKRLFFIACCMFPICWILVGFFVVLTLNLIDLSQNKEASETFPLVVIVVTTIIVAVIGFFYFNVSIFLPRELYEFREKGIYYVKKQDEKGYLKMVSQIRKGKIEEAMSFLPYEDIDVFKVWFHVVAKTPVNGANVYQIDFYVITRFDEVIHIHTGMVGVSQEKVRLTAEILKEHAKTIRDPFKILEHMDQSDQEFYDFLNEVYRRKEHLRVFGSIK